MSLQFPPIDPRELASIMGDPAAAGDHSTHTWSPPPRPTLLRRVLNSWPVTFLTGALVAFVCLGVFQS